jgi:uncharacterized protein (DUF433 family)
MDDQVVRDRIRTDSGTFGGKPTIRDTRVAVEHVLAMLAEGVSSEEIIREYPFLSDEDIRACMTYAWQLVSHEHIEPLAR